MRNLCDTALMSCDVPALLFQTHANYVTWSKDFGAVIKKPTALILFLSVFDLEH